jgi:Bacterial virulence factor lipase N-terminal
MKRLTVSILVLVGSSCDPVIDSKPSPAVIVARFDPAAAVPVVPTPNDLATNPATGMLAVTIPANASGADKAFYEWLNTLDGFPASATATTTFTGGLDAASVSPNSVRVLDLDNANSVVPVMAVSASTGNPDAPEVLSIPPPTGGWTLGHRYALAIVGGSAGVKGKDGQAVVGTPTWALIRAAKSLVTCSDLMDATCAPTTGIIPSSVRNDEAARLADQTKSALRLEALRRKYAPALEALVATGLKREDIVLAWTFKVASNPIFVFSPAGAAPKVPTPTNLAIVNGVVNAPIDPATSPANQEFTADYLNSLNGFPPTAAAVANVAGGDLDPASISNAAFKVIAVAGGPLAGEPTYAFNQATRSIVVTPSGGSWGRAKTIAIAAIAGVPSGLKGVNGKPLAASDAWALARAASPLVDCMNLMDPACKLSIAAAPLSLAQARSLEAVRRGYAPVLDALAKGGLLRANVVGLWVFSTVNQPQLNFDLTATPAIVPFPNNQFLRSADDISPTGKLTFPVPDGASGALFAGLNTLDGFSTTAPIVSENANDKAALDEETIDPASVEVSALFAKLDGAGPLKPNVKACLNCTSSTGGAMPQPEQLQWVPQRPLEPLTRYAAFVTTDMKDAKGRPVSPSSTFALVRLKNPLLDDTGKSTLSVLSDALAAKLEPVRLRFKDCLDKIEATGVPRKKIALGFCVTTQSTTSVVQKLAGAVAATPASALPDVPTYLADVTVATKQFMTAAQIPSAALGKIFSGVMVLPNGLSATTKTLDPNPANWKPRKAPFTLYLPTACPAAGCPVTIFGHGLTRNRNDSVGLANALAAAGQATIAIDAVLHGDRSDCVGVKSLIPGAPSDDAACADPVTQQCDAQSGRCVARDQTAALACDPAAAGDATCITAGKGYCQIAGPNAGKCEGGDYSRRANGEVNISSANFLNLGNLFATRDNFRYTGSIDFAALVRLLKSTSATSLSAQLQLLGAPSLNTALINYTGQSLGSFNGSVFAASSGVANNVALNVPGSSQVDVLLSSPGFKPQRDGFLASLAASNLTPGTAAYDQFFVLARTILDPADPRNLIYDAVNSANASRKIYFQTIEDDQVLPNFTADFLTEAAEQNPARSIQKFRFTVANNGITAAYLPANRHGFLLNPSGNPDCNPLTTSCATVVGQSKLTTFIATGVAP